MKATPIGLTAAAANSPLADDPVEQEFNATTGAPDSVPQTTGPRA